jgi:TRAP-type C4-dicarboxylate transport system substrate-binding protein
LFLTSIIVNQDFFQTFDAEVQEIMTRAAFNAARTERRESVADIPNILLECKEKGVEVVRMSQEEQSKFESVTGQVYDKFANYFSPGLVDSIRTLQ